MSSIPSWLIPFFHQLLLKFNQLLIKSSTVLLLAIKTELFYCRFTTWVVVYRNFKNKPSEHLQPFLCPIPRIFPLLCSKHNRGFAFDRFRRFFFFPSFAVFCAQIMFSPRKKTLFHNELIFFVATASIEYVWTMSL